MLLRTALTLCATLVGALVAFQLQNSRENRKETKRRISALNLALFTLIRQINALANFIEDLEPLKNDVSRCFKVQPWQSNKYEDIKFNFEELSFILDSDNPNILHYLLIEQERFEQTLKTIQLRSEYQVNIIQPILESANIGNKRLPFEEIEKILGKYKLEGIILATDKVYEHVYKTFESSSEFSKNLHKFAKQQYPKIKFLSPINET